MMNNSQVEINQNPTERLYFCGLIFYMLLYLQYETQWSYGELLSWSVEILAIICLSLHAVLTFPHYTNTKDKNLFIFAFVVTIIVGLNASFLKGVSLLYVLSVSFLLVFGAKNIEFRKILKVYFFVGCIYCVVTVFASLSGIIPNLIDDGFRAEEAIGAVDNVNRMCLGYGWPTNMANHVFFILLTFFYWINRTFKKKEMLLFLFITLVVLYYTGSRLSTFCVLLMLFFTVCFRTNRGERLLTNKWICYFLIICIPLFAFISYYVTNAFDESNMDWMVADVVLSGRLHIGKDALEIGGIPLLGQFYEMNSSVRDDGNAYNYIDCSYIQALVIYGLVYTMLVVFAYICICRNAYRRKDYFLMYSIFFAGVSGLIAQHFIEMYMNPFLIALFANHTVDESIDGVA